MHEDHIDHAWPSLKPQRALAKTPHPIFHFWSLWRINANFSEHFYALIWDLLVAVGCWCYSTQIPFLLTDKTSSTMWRRLQKNTYIFEKKKHVKTATFCYNRFFHYVISDHMRLLIKASTNKQTKQSSLFYCISCNKELSTHNWNTSSMSFDNFHLFCQSKDASDDNSHVNLILVRSHLKTNLECLRMDPKSHTVRSKLWIWSSKTMTWYWQPLHVLRPEIKSQLSWKEKN